MEEKSTALSRLTELSNSTGLTRASDSFQTNLKPGHSPEPES